VTESGDIVRILFRGTAATSTRKKEIVAKIHSNQTRALVDFNVEFAVVGKYKDYEGRAGTLFYKIKDHDFLHLKYKQWINTIKKETHLRKKQRFGQMKKNKSYGILFR
jgi:hypothetical protein